MRSARPKTGVGAANREDHERGDSAAAPVPARPDLRALLWHALFAVLLVIPAVGVVVVVVVALASVPVLVALFPITLTLAAVALAVLYRRHRRDQARRHRAKTAAGDQDPA